MGASEGIAKTNERFISAFKAGDAAGVGACYSEDGWFMVPNAETFKGKEAIVGAFQGLIDAGINSLNLSTTEIIDLGEAAIEHGEYTLYAGENVADHGRFMVHWININGSWCLHRDIINSDQPLPQ